MFGRQKRKERIEVISANIATLVEMSFRSIKRAHEGKLPKEIETDGFVLTYIAGVATAGAFAVGMGEKHNALEQIVINTFDHLFPGKGEELAKRCLDPSEIWNWKAPLDLATQESRPVFKAMLTGNLEPVDSIGSLASLDAHLEKTYP